MSRRTACSVAALLCLMASVSAAWGAEFRITPSFGISEEANDNIREQAGSGRSEYITRVQPGAALRYEGGSSLLDASYNLDYRYYARNTRSEEFNHNGSLSGTFGFFEKFLTLEMKDTFSRVSLDIARDVTQESVLVNQTDQNLASVSPYLTWRLGGKGTLKTGYRYNDARYWHSTSAIDKRTNSAFADYAYQLSERMTLNAGYTFSDTDTETSRYKEHDVSGGFRYEYGNNSFLFGSVGNSWLDFSTGQKISDMFWDVGASRDFGLLIANLETKVQYTEDPLTLSTQETTYKGGLEKVLTRGRLAFNASYSEFKVTLFPEQNRRRLQLTLDGSQELLTGLIGKVSLLGERLSNQSSNSGEPISNANARYRLMGTGTLTWTIGDGVTLAGTYSHISYRNELDSDSGTIEVNRGILEVRKTF